ncbi:DNA polymerase III subunit delta [Candidatus Pelagibacter communis]|uniref:DNA polymerase III subunit delta n=1 Tax=Pelagibacter ubique TaxID=198252 RepID=UPI00094DE08B|nr:DNA polymerase III subunit delta [Candidatus Pelagibacter ubique]
MIIKNHEIKKQSLDKYKFFLLYGKNDGLKNKITEELIDNNTNIKIYEEKELLENKNIFLESINSGSLFEKKRHFVIKRITDKILNIFNEIKDSDDIKIIFNSDNLEKKSRLRNLFEKDKKLVCIPFYPDTEQTLATLAYNYFKEKKISVSQNLINMIVNKCNYDRVILFNELSKIESYLKNQKKLDLNNILKLVNLTENISIQELIDNCLIQNKRKTVFILNENNFSNDDSILIIRYLLNKCKKLASLVKEYEKNRSIDLTISSARPPIFWKEKNIIKEQIQIWNLKDLKKLMYKINKIELQTKKNISNSLNFINDFILEISNFKTSNKI